MQALRVPSPSSQHEQNNFLGLRGDPGASEDRKYRQKIGKRDPEIRKPKEENENGIKKAIEGSRETHPRTGGGKEKRPKAARVTTTLRKKQNGVVRKKRAGGHQPLLEQMVEVTRERESSTERHRKKGTRDNFISKLTQKKIWATSHESPHPLGGIKGADGDVHKTGNLHPFRLQPPSQRRGGAWRWEAGVWAGAKSSRFPRPGPRRTRLICNRSLWIRNEPLARLSLVVQYVDTLPSFLLVGWLRAFAKADRIIFRRSDSFSHPTPHDAVASEVYRVLEEGKEGGSSPLPLPESSVLIAVFQRRGMTGCGSVLLPGNRRILGETRLDGLKTTLPYLTTHWVQRLKN